MALLVRSELGLIPWDVLHQGLARRLDVSMGTAVIGLSLLVLLTWVPLRERPGIGTVSNALLIGLVLDAALLLLPPVGSLAARSALVALGCC